MYRIPVDEYLTKGVWRRLSLAEEFFEAANRFASRTAVVSGESRLTYRQLAENIRHLARGFLSIGIRSGDRVLIQLPNRLSLIETVFALFRIGAVPIMSLPASSVRDVEALCMLAEPVAYISTDRSGGVDYSGMYEALHNVPSLKYFLSDNGKVSDSISLGDLLLSPALSEEVPYPSFQDMALLLLSGGTTGTPKLIPRRHADYAYNARAASLRCKLDEESRYLVVLPAAHNFSLSAPGILGVFENGGTVILSENAGPDAAFPLIEREKVTFTALVPALLSLWLEAREWEDFNLSSLRFIQVGGAAVDPALARRVTPELGCRMMNVFGTAEGLICTTSLDDNEDIISTTEGRPISSLDEVRIVDAHFQDTEPGVEGEMIVRGPYTIQGYYRAPEVNRTAVTEDGFYRTGDIARFDSEGRIIVCGRIKDQINRAGEKIAPVEVENLLRAMPGVNDAAVAALPDEELGERICAWIITESVLSLQEVLHFCSENGLARYKCPDQLEIIGSFPLTTVGKVDKKALVTSLLQRKEH